MNEHLLARNVSVYYGQNKALHEVSLNFEPRRVTALIGPSGCGKSTFLRCLNRMNDLVPGARVEGEILLDGDNILTNTQDIALLRAKVGMVFQKPTPFPMSIYDNIAYGPRTHGIRSHVKLDEIVETSLRHAAIWDDIGWLQALLADTRQGALAGAQAEGWGLDMDGGHARLRIAGQRL